MIKYWVLPGKSLKLLYVLNENSDYTGQHHNASYDQEAKVKNPDTTQSNGCHYHNRWVTTITVRNVTEVTRCGADKHEFSLYP